MARYRVYLMDEAQFVQGTAVVECAGDADAVDHARTMIRPGGRVDLWTDDVLPSGLIGWFHSDSDPFSFALVRRIRVRPTRGNPPATRPVVEWRRLCLA